MKKDKKLYSIFMVAIITILGYLIYSNYQLQQKVSNLEKDIPKIEDRLSQQNIQFEDVNEKVSDMIEKEKTEQYYENLTQEEKLKHPTWVEDDYYFDNSSIEGKTSITEDKAIEIWNEYRKNIILNDLDEYKVKKVTTGKVNPTNNLTAGTGWNVKKADYERNAYIIYCSDVDDLSSITGYVDMYTGKVIGGFYGGV